MYAAPAWIEEDATTQHDRTRNADTHAHYTICRPCEAKADEKSCTYSLSYINSQNQQYATILKISSHFVNPQKT